MECGVAGACAGYRFPCSPPVRQPLCIDGYEHFSLTCGLAGWNFQSTDSLPGLHRSCRAVISRQALPRKACGPGLFEIREAFAIRGVVNFRVLPDAQHAPYPGLPIALSLRSRFPARLSAFQRAPSFWKTSSSFRVSTSGSAHAYRSDRGADRTFASTPSGISPKRCRNR